MSRVHSHETQTFLMDIPTSQAHPDRPSISLDTCLSQLATGTFAYGQLAAFSDLTRGGLRQVESAWPQIGHETRRRLISEAVELAEENVQYRFERLCRFALRDPDADVRQVALSGLWEDESASLLEELIEVAQTDASPDVRAGAIVLLGNAIPRLRDEDPDSDLLEAIESLAITLAGEDTRSTVVRRRAIEAIGALEQTDQTRTLILSAYQYGDQALEAGAIVAMGRSLEARWLTVVRSLLASEDPEIRFEASQALGQIGTTDDVTELSKLTLDEDADVRLAAITALGEIGGHGAVRVLRNRMNQASELEQDAIREALDAALLTTDPLRLPT